MMRSISSVKFSQCRTKPGIAAIYCREIMVLSRPASIRLSLASEIPGLNSTESKRIWLGCRKAPGCFGNPAGIRFWRFRNPSLMMLMKPTLALGWLTAFALGHAAFAADSPDQTLARPVRKEAASRHEDAAGYFQ